MRSFSRRIPAEFKSRIYLGAPPQIPRFVDDEGNWSLRPFVYGYKRKIDPATFTRRFVEDRNVKYPIYFFVRGEPYKMWNLFWPGMSTCSARPQEATSTFSARTGWGGTSSPGVLYGGRVSLSVGLVGVLLTLFFGSVFGTVAGYYGGAVDNVLMRGTELMMAFPSLPLWMALAAAVPPQWPPIAVYFGITIILSIISWGGLGGRSGA